MQEFHGALAEDGHSTSRHKLPHPAPARAPIPIDRDPSSPSAGVDRAFGTLRWVGEDPTLLDVRSPIITDHVAPGDILLIVGAPGVGKTWLGLEMAMSVTRGDDYLGFRTGLPELKVLVIDAESGPARLEQRLRAIANAHGVVQFAGLDVAHVTPAVVDLRKPRALAWLQGVVQEVKPVLIVVDALADFLGEGSDSNQPDVLPVLNGLRRIAHHARTAVVVLHHTGRNGSFRGSTAITGAVDLALQLKPSGARRGGDTSLSLTVSTIKARDAAPLSYGVRIRFDGADSTTRTVRCTRADMAPKQLGVGAASPPGTAPASASSSPRMSAKRVMRAPQHTYDYLVALAAERPAGVVRRQDWRAASDLSEPTFKRHVAFLLAAGLIRSDRHGRATVYSPVTQFPDQTGQPQPGS